MITVLPLTAWANSTPVGAPTPYPVGLTNYHEPSALAPPPSNALSRYHLTSVNDFKHPGPPYGWYPFTGLAGGIPTDRFSAHHLVVARGLLRLKTYRDPTNANRWTTAGL